MMKPSEEPEMKWLKMWQTTDNIFLQEDNWNLFFEHISDFHHVTKLTIRQPPTHKNVAI